MLGLTPSIRAACLFVRPRPTSWSTSVSRAAIAIYRLKEGRIAECWVEPNLLGLALQTGAVSVARGLLATGDQGPRLD